MALKKFDRVQETTATTGTGQITLAGAVSGFRAFSSVLANNDEFPYAILDGTAWETGVGTWLTGGLMDRRLKDSSTGSLINLSGTATVFMSPIAFLDRAAVTYAPTSTTLAGFTGTVDVIGNLANTNNVPNIYTETAVATNAVDVNFTGLGDITHIIFRSRYLDGTAAHSITVKAYDYNAAAYSAAIYTINPTKDFDYDVIELTNDQRANFKNASGNGIIRFEHTQTGAAGHLFTLDYCVFKFNPALNESTSDPLSSRLINVQKLTTGTTYTPTVGTAFVEVSGCGGGGQGGGGATASSNLSCGSGGGGGGTFTHLHPIVSGQTVTYAIGTAGSGASNGAAGTAGGNTTWAAPIDNVVAAATVTAYGGGGGTVMTAATTAGTTTAGGLGGAIATNATVTGAGLSGMIGTRASASSGQGGKGGDSPYGAGGAGRAATTGTGTAGTGNGSGGGGSVTTGTSNAGAAGTAGIIYVFEYS